MSDEQPGSWMFYEADLHTDRLSANKQRSVAWNYRNLELCPAEVLPGFAMHQTDRDPTELEKTRGGQRSNFHARARDFDLLGYRYSILSTVGTAGLNNVLNMLPARDKQEFSLLPKADIAFVKGWMAWTDAHVAWVRNTKTITKQPSGGKLDAVAMVDGSDGAVFVYNPTASWSAFPVTFNASLGFATAGCGGAKKLAVSASGSSNRDFTPHKLTVVECGATLNVSIPPSTALSFEFTALPSVVEGSSNGDDQDNVDPAAEIQIFGGAATVHVSWETQTLSLTETAGPAGESAELLVTLPPTTLAASQQAGGALTSLRFVSIDNAPPIAIGSPDCQPEHEATGRCVAPTVYHGRVALRLRGKWSGIAFSNEIGSTKGFTGGQWQGTFTVPAAAIEQLTARNTSYPIKYDLSLDGNDDANVPWLAPGRLLIFAKYRPLLNDTFNATGSIDGVPLIVRKGYNSIVRSPQRFIGYWADATSLVKPGTKQTLKLTLPGSSKGGYAVENGFINAGNDLGTANVTIAEAEEHCSAQDTCVGFTFQKTSEEGTTACTAITGTQKILYKSAMSGTTTPSWCKVLKPASPVGIFFENVQPLMGSFELTTHAL